MTALILLKDWDVLQIELWKPVKDFPNYEISNKGRVRSYFKTSSVGRASGRNGWKGGWTQIVCDVPKLLSPRADKDGYRVAHLTRNGKAQNRRVHQLVAKAFVPNEREGIATIPNHINNVSGDNRAENLSWMTISENTLYGNEIGTGMRGENHVLAKLTAKEVLQIRADEKALDNRHVWASYFNCTPENIVRIVLRKTWQYI